MSENFWNDNFGPEKTPGTPEPLVVTIEITKEAQMILEEVMCDEVPTYSDAIRGQLEFAQLLVQQLDDMKSAYEKLNAFTQEIKEKLEAKPKIWTPT